MVSARARNSLRSTYASRTVRGLTTLAGTPAR